MHNRGSGDRIRHKNYKEFDMSAISSSSIGERISSTIKSGIQAIGNLFGRAVQYIKDTPASMQQSKNKAIAVFAVANLPIVFVADKVAKLVEGRSDGSVDAKGSATLKLLGGNLLFGSVVAAGNYGVSIVTKYTLAPKVLAAVTVALVAARILFNFISSDVAPTADKANKDANAQSATTDQAKKDAEKLKPKAAKA